MAIKNKPTKSDPATDKLRNAFEHRALWMYLLMDEARKRGLDWEDFARKAILRCGRMHGDVKFHKETDLEKFGKAFANQDVIDVFEMDVQQADDKKLYIEFHYCPLLTAWQKAGASDEDCATLCDIAMEGDRGIVEVCPGLKFTLGDTVDKGGSCCQVCVEKV